MRYGDVFIGLLFGLAVVIAALALGYERGWMFAYRAGQCDALSGTLVVTPTRPEKPYCFVGDTLLELKENK